MEERTTGRLARHVAGPLLEYLRGEFGDCEFAEPPVPLAPGNQTVVHAFRLKGLAPPLDRALVLRLFPPGTDPLCVRIEAVLQNAIAAQGFPAARAYATCEREDVLGAPFFVMERLPGVPFFGDSLKLEDSGVPRITPRAVVRDGLRMLLRVPRVCAEVEARIHGLDASQLITALEEAHLPWNGLTLAGKLQEMSGLIDTCSLRGLPEAHDWLCEHLPAQDDHRVVCHGDMQPLNLLVECGEVVGVVDWSNALFAPPECAIGWTRASFLTLPLSLPGPLGLADRPVAHAIARGYERRYRRRRPYDRGAVAYYEAFRSLLILCHIAEKHARNADIRDAWNTQAGLDLLAAHFQAISGQEVAVPRL